jgi:hypothetical protein
MFCPGRRRWMLRCPKRVVGTGKEIEIEREVH